MVTRAVWIHCKTFSRALLKSNSLEETEGVRIYMMQVRVEVAWGRVVGDDHAILGDIRAAYGNERRETTSTAIRDLDARMLRIPDEGDILPATSGKLYLPYSCCLEVRSQ